MAIKENALPLGASSGSGSYIRTVSSGGESQRTPFDVVKGAMNADIETALENEVSAREDADTALRGEITDAVAAEATARDQAIADAIATEVTDRNAAIAEAQGETDQAISAAISGEVTARNQAIASAIQTETADRTAAIQEAIADEVTDRNAAIESAIDDEETARNTAISEAVAAEAQAREAADEELNQSKANTDGNYPDMTVGNADQLISSIYTEDQTPYNFRQSGGGLSIGDREIDKIVGGTIVWNQQINDSVLRSGATSGVTLAKNNDGTLTLSGQATNVFRITEAITTSTRNHKWFVCDANHRVTLYNGTASEGVASAEKGGIIAQTGSDSMYLYCQENGTDFGNGVVIRPIAIDLTQMFGSAIADYIYSLEQATAGAGVAYFRQLFQKLSLAYNAGELMSVQVASHDMVGFNQWDEDWEVGDISASTGANTSSTSVIRTKNYIPILPKTVYFAKFGTATGYEVRSRFYDADKNFICTSAYGGTQVQYNQPFTTPENARYMRFTPQPAYGTTYKNDICINLSHNGSRNGEYAPYEKHSYELDGNQTLRGVPKLDASNNLYYDGDPYESDGTVTRNIVEVDMAGLAATTPYTGSTNKTVSLTLNPPFPQNYSDYAFLSEKYPYRGHVNSASAMNDPDSKDVGIYAYHNSQLTDRFRIYVVIPVGASIEGKLVYKKATPTIEQATPYTNPQTVSDWGTEEYVDAAVQEGDRDVAVPVGHVTDYLANLRDKLQNLPDAAGADGTYLVQQTSGQMALLAYTPGVNIPAAPTTDGTYTLQAVVSGGVATYSWVSS